MNRHDELPNRHDELQFLKGVLKVLKGAFKVTGMIVGGLLAFGAVVLLHWLWGTVVKPAIVRQLPPGWRTPAESKAIEQEVEQERKAEQKRRMAELYPDNNAGGARRL